MGNTPVNNLMQTGSAARCLERSPQMVRIYADQGKLPVAAITETGARLFRREDVEALRDRLQGGGRA